jgi:hypothetical protein
MKTIEQPPLVEAMNTNGTAAQIKALFYKQRPEETVESMARLAADMLPYVLRGMHVFEAGIVCGVPAKTMKLWLRYGDRDPSMTDDNALKEMAPYMLLRDTLRRAEATAEWLLLEEVHKNGPSASCALALLERRFPTRWAQNHSMSSSE